MKTFVLLISIVALGSTAAFWMAGAMPMRWGVAPDHVAPAKLRASPDVVRVVGYVEPVSEIRKLTFKADGVIDTCRVHVGQSVEAGEILATLRSRDEQAAVGVAEQELAIARAELDKLMSGTHPQQIAAAERRVAKFKERVNIAQITLERERRLLDRHNLAKEEFDVAKSAVRQAEEELNEAMADVSELKTHVRPHDKALAEVKVKLAEANVVAAQERLRNTILMAPIRGTVLEILKREGEAIRVFDQQPMMIFADLSQMRVRAEVDERFVHLIRPGQEAFVHGRGLGDHRYKAKIALVKPLMGNKTVFSRESGERKDLDVLEVLVQPDSVLNVPIGLQVEVDIHLASPRHGPEALPAAGVIGSDERPGGSDGPGVG
jgi:multidrug resistance efflux pump